MTVLRMLECIGTGSVPILTAMARLCMRSDMTTYSRPDVAPFRTANIWKDSQATLHSVSSTACPVKLVYLNGRNLKRAEMSDGGLTGVG